MKFQVLILAVLITICSSVFIPTDDLGSNNRAHDHVSI